MMDTETKPHSEGVSEIHDAPSIAPDRGHTFEDVSHRSYPRLKPQQQIAVAGGQAVRRSRMSMVDIAKHTAGVLGLTVGFAFYLVVILSVVAASLCWMPFSREDKTSDRA